MVDGNATGFDKEASHTTLQRRVTLAEAKAELLYVKTLLLQSFTHVKCEALLNCTVERNG
jgi:hypothetical protein